ncbi:flagellar basal body rod protein FlgC [Ferrimonas marina]|uniref:Flagellar basal-body rod protein FlgC n=1 Tax=Ferrimonas marina TaxID=299255 RepID=A0A1M5TFG3_9GAMM|nr:flagellar basal body rod protein FlgC [Ferrimonas marina]SHH49555.1 flagellar basal-body rod protein FlgC [Ferrimonas marina]
MSIINAIDVSASGMSAQSTRLNTIASNLANAESVSSSEAEAFRAKLPLFESHRVNPSDPGLGVRVTEIVESKAPPTAVYSPNHPLADPNGYVYKSNVNTVEQMADMMSAQRSFEANVEVLKASKSLAEATIRAMGAK